MLRTYTFPVDVFCGACTPHVEDLIRKTGLKIIGKIDTCILKKTTTFQVEINPEDENNTEEILKTALRDGGRLIEESEQTSPELTPTPSPAILPPPAPRVKSNLQHWLQGDIPSWLRWLLGGIGVTSGLAMLALMVLSIPLSFPVMAALGVLSAVLSLALGGPTIYRAGKNLISSGAVNMDTLYALGGLTAIGITIAHLFIPGIPMLFDAALFIFGFKHIGDSVKKLATHQTEREINFSERAKITAITEPSDDKIELDKIIVGSIIRIPRGAIIPIDGIMLDDNACVYTTLINGKTTPKIYGKNKEALAGLRVAEDNPNDYIRIQTIRSAQDSYLNQLDKRLAQEKNKTPQIISVSENILRWFIPVVIALAIISAIVITACFFPALGLLGAVAIGAKCLVAVLVSACPCTLGLIVPLAAKAGIDKAAQHQVLFKDDKKLQAAAQVDTIIFDLNGTLTTGKPVVKSFFATKNREQVLAYATALESHSCHAFARAIREYGVSTQTKPRECSVANVIKSRTGISAMIEGKRVCIGNASMMENEKLDVESYHAKNNVVKEEIQQLVYVVMEGDIVGHFVLEDSVRPGAKQSINKLKSLGYEIHMCTGADDKTANAYAAALGIEHVYARCQNVAAKSDCVSVRTKSDYINKRRAEGKMVAMVGDGGNDAIPMMTSHLGVGIKSSSSDEMTLDLAGAVIDSPSLLPVVALFEVAKQTVANIKQNVMASLSLNSLTIAAAIIGTALTALGVVFPPAIGAGLMVLLLVPVLINVARLKSQALPHFEEAKAQAQRDVYTSAELMKTFGLANNFPRHIERVQATSEDSFSPSTPALAYGEEPQKSGSDPFFCIIK